ncbi:MAG: AAA family ATPase [Saprospiraceae bacterium]|nr:AAA family ATPase [Saprospiraceae bacterium]
MIFIERSAQPAWFNSPEVEDVFQKQKDFMLHEQNQHEIRTGRFDQDQFTLPMDEGMEKELVQVFKNKCPFCESLVIGTNAAHFTPDMANRRSELERLIAVKEKGEQFKKGMTRGFNSYYGEETKEGFEAYDIGFLRPELRAMNANGTVSPAHYWWLGWDWHNLFLICRSCLTAKENKFPIAALNRASFGEEMGLRDLRQGLEKEEALLIDPCQTGDFQQRHILFRAGKALGTDEMGQQTIDVFKLNRPRLAAVRRFVSKALSEEIELIFRGDKPMRKVLSPSHPFVASILDEWWLNSSQDSSALAHCRAIFEGDLPGYLETEAAPSTSYTDDQVSTIEKEQEEVEKAKNSYDLEKRENLAAYFTKSLWIEKVVLTDFKAFESLTLDFPDTSTQLNTRQLKTDTSRPWLALLGENGVGKSSISQAIALTLMGKSKLESMELDLNGFIRFDQPKAKVEVFLLNREEPIVLEITRDGEHGSFSLNEEAPQVLMMAYGATRLPSQKTILGQDEKSFIRTSNLFDPNAKLGNGFNWLGDDEQVPENIFLPLKEGLTNLLQLEEGQEIKRDPVDKQLFLEEDVAGQVAKKKTPFKYLSSGYQTVLAITLDIMMGTAELLKYLSTDDSSDATYSLLDVAGIVMIDEIGVHLHPRWKMRIVKTLKRTFPKMSFIITTHEPLCLRGLKKGEVAILQRDKDQKNKIDIQTDGLPSVQQLSIQELLTSTFFGLNSIMDPEVEKKYDDYYKLLAGVELEDTEAEEERQHKLAQLKKELEGANLKLGNTITEEVEYKLIEDKVALAKSKKDIFEKIEDTDRKKIIDTWDKVLSSSSDQ